MIELGQSSRDNEEGSQREGRKGSVTWANFNTAHSDISPCISESESEEILSDQQHQYVRITKNQTRHDLKMNASNRRSGAKLIDDAIFDAFKDHSETILIGKFLAMLEKKGLKRSDYRLQNIVSSLRSILKEKEAIHRALQDSDYFGSIETLHLSREEFSELILPSIFIVSSAFRDNFIIPKFHHFTNAIERIYMDCKGIRDGKAYNNLKKLANADPNSWGVAVCTIDGQRFAVGETSTAVTLQGLTKPLMYGYALQEVGRETVHEYVGQEPSGHEFNELVLDHKNRPHNPIINAGSIMIHALLGAKYRPEMTPGKRFNETHKLFERLSGKGYIGFNNGIFLSKRATSDRSWALGYFMKEQNCFPPGVDLENRCIEYFLQTLSMETNMEVLSVIASTFANGGICPVSGQRVFSEEVVADVLSVLFSCGMLEFSGKFGFRVGLPAKSSISGAILLVVPKVCGIALWSPPLDKFNNSVRGVAFCEKLVETYNFHCFDVDKGGKIDPTRKNVETKGCNAILLNFSAAAGDLESICRLHLCGVNMGLHDCDGRTALHVAASEGHYHICDYLLRQCGEVRHEAKNRWGKTAYDEAVQFGHERVANLLKNWHLAKKRKNHAGS